MRSSCGNDVRLQIRLACGSVAICSVMEPFGFRTTGDGPLGPDGVLAGSVQFVAQHKRAAFAAEDCSPLFALLQQLDILPWFSEWSGIPAATPPAIARSRRMDVTRFFTFEPKPRRLLIHLSRNRQLHLWINHLATCMPSNPPRRRENPINDCGRGSCTSPSRERLIRRV